MTTRRRIAWVAAGLLAAAAVLWWRGRPPAPPTVAVGTVRRTVLEVAFSVEGETRATQVAVAPRAPARVVRFRVREGDRVASGQILAELDRREADAAVGEARAALEAARSEADRTRAAVALALRAASAQERQARAGIDEARARLRGLRAGGRPEAVAQAEHRRDQLRAVAQEARRAWERARALLDEGAVSRADVDRAQARADAAEQEVGAAEDALAQAQAGATLEERQAAEASVRAAEARADEARASVEAAQARRREVQTLESRVRQAASVLARVRAGQSDSLLRAPFAGVVAQLHGDPGMLAGPGSPALTLVDPASLWVEARVPDEESGRVFVGQRVAVSAPALPGRRLSGTVRAVAAAAEPRADASSHTHVVRARIALDAGRDALRPGLEVDVQGTHRSASPVLLAPSDAVVPDGGRGIVWRVEGARVRRVAVTIGETTGAQTVVEGDLRDGDRVVVSGKEGLRDGGSVTVAAPSGGG